MKWIITLVAAVALVATADSAGLQDEHCITPDWILVHKFDLTQGGHCPDGWTNITANMHQMCRSTSDSPGCYSAVFSVHNTSYNKIRGMVRGYQKGSTDAFVRRNYKIEQAYVDGVSITLSGTGVHVWTYASGLSSRGDYPKYNCPCAAVPGPSSPSYVGKNYYCESGNQAEMGYDYPTYYTDNPLWDKAGCMCGDDCCSDVRSPWFYREFTTMRTEDIEVRICTDGGFGNEGVLVDQLALYIQ